MDNIETFKDIMRKGMIQNFEKYGYLSPVFFLLKNDVPVLTPIPIEDMKTPENKMALSKTFKEACRDPEVSCAGLISEAYTRIFKATESNSELFKLLQNGNLRVADLKEKNDIIYMVFSTPNKEEIISYFVDPKTKTVMNKMDTNQEKTIKSSGIFTNFFEFRH